MANKIPVDKAGRLVLPKSLRDQMRISPGDNLLLESEGDRITLRPERAQPLLKKELGIWVYQGESSELSIPDSIDAQRQQRLKEFAE